MESTRQPRFPEQRVLWVHALVILSFNCSRHISEMQHDTGGFVIPPMRTHAHLHAIPQYCVTKPLAHLSEGGSARQPPKEGLAKMQPTYFPKSSANLY